MPGFYTLIVMHFYHRLLPFEKEENASNDDGRLDGNGKPFKPFGNHVMLDKFFQKIRNPMNHTGNNEAGD